MLLPRHPPMHAPRHLMPVLLIWALAGCAAVPITSTTLLLGDAGLITLTKPGEKGPADTADQMVAHESWCYRTIGGPQCFSGPQDVPADRLINVDPPSAYPVTIAAYNEAVLAAQTPPPSGPAVLAVPPGSDGPPSAILDPTPEQVSPANRFRPPPPPPDWVSAPQVLPAPILAASDGA